MTNVQSQTQWGGGAHQLLAETSQDHPANWQSSSECAGQAEEFGSDSKRNRNLHRCDASSAQR